MKYSDNIVSEAPPPLVLVERAVGVRLLLPDFAPRGERRGLAAGE